MLWLLLTIGCSVVSLVIGIAIGAFAVAAYVGQQLEKLEPGYKMRK